MSPRDYASVPERITWTTGFRVATDKLVLGALSTFANFQTGEGAKPAIDTLAARANLPRRTIQRALSRLERDQWIAVTARRHRRPTTYRICVERLAENWIGAKVVQPLTADILDGSQSLRATGGAQEPVDILCGSQSLRAISDALRATGGALDPVLRATGGAPSPVRTDPLYRSPVRREEPSLRAGLSAETGTTTKTPERSAEAKVEPYQPTLGPLDVSHERTPTDYGRLTQLFHDVLSHTTTPRPRKPERRQG